jgi:hypothetical protein
MPAQHSKGLLWPSSHIMSLPHMRNERRYDKHLLLITYLIHAWRVYGCMIERAATSHFRRY